MKFYTLINCMYLRSAQSFGYQTVIQKNFPAVQRYMCSKSDIELSDIALEKINEASAEQLQGYNLSQSFALRIIKRNEDFGLLDDTYQLNDIGLKGSRLKIFCSVVKSELNSIAYLQKTIAKYSDARLHELYSKEDYIKIEKLYKMFRTKYKTGKICSQVIPFNFLKSLNTFASLSLSTTHISYVVMGAEGNLIDAGCHHFCDEQQPDSNIVELTTIYDQIDAFLKRMPAVDLFVLENAENLKRKFNVSLSHDHAVSMLYGMMFSIVDNRKTPEDIHPMVLMHRTIVNQLFQLQVGSERIAGLSIADLIFSGNPPVSIKHFSPTEFSTKILEKYVLTNRNERIRIMEALLPAIGFHTFVIKPANADDDSLWK